MITLIITFLCGTGLHLILADLFRIPSYAASKATNNLGRRQNRKTNPIEIWCRGLSGLLADKLKLSEYRKAQLEADLKTADINMTPEVYVADCIVKSLLIGILAVPVFFIAPVFSAVIIFLAFVMYVNYSKKVSNVIKEKRIRIEAELPRLVLNIEKTLKHTRDVLYILESYKETAGPELKREFEITVADMRSGNYEVALTRLESRVGSTMMSDVTRGLIGVLRGDNTDVYWCSLVLKFSDYQRQLLKREANKMPKKVRRLSMALLICFMLIYIVVIGQVLLESIGTMF